jgi:uncharacterized NAD(P)/FAD-binding protein YdhS
MSGGAGPNLGSPDLDPRETVAIVGGGFSGAVVAHQIARRAPGRFRILVIEPRASLGAGVAYSTPDPAHRVNVPASRMSFVPSDPCHFDRWLKADGELARDPAAVTGDGRAFPRRAVFGRYVAESLDPYLLSGEIEHRRGRAEAIIRTGRTGFRVRLDDGETIAASYVALAATHPSPAAPTALASLRGDPRLICDTQDPRALDALSPYARVLIVGTGLTMGDIVASLERRGHRGPIVAVSRRGLLSRGHAAVPGEYGAFDQRPAETALDLLGRIRRTVKAAEAAGTPWQHVLEAVRSQGRAIWAALPEAERRKVARRLRPYWDVHRFRIAPQVEAAIRRLAASGQLTMFAGEPVGAHAAGDGITVALKRRHGPVDALEFDAVTLATGPAHGGVCESHPLIRTLSQARLVSADRIGLGLATTATSLSLSAGGAPVKGLWIAGPLARATFGELMGLPEVTRHAEFVACEVVNAADAALVRETRAVA